MKEYDLRSGNIVCILNKDGLPILGEDDEPIKYQAISVYLDKQKVGLVNHLGEYIGIRPIAEISYLSEGPMFSKEDYEVDMPVEWIDNDGAYEGIINVLFEGSARVINVKKLYPVDYSVKVPYWKLSNRIPTE